MSAGTTNIVEHRKETVKTSSPDSKAWRAAVLQSLREGTVAEVQEVLADLEAAGHISRDEDPVEEETHELGSDDGTDAEIDLADEDAAFIEDWDENPTTRPDAAFSPTSDRGEEDERPESEPVIELVVGDGVCRVQRPIWMRFHARTPFGQDSIDDFDRRFSVLEHMAGWLTQHRGNFLLEPDPWHLGCEALNELREGRASVSPGAFLQLTGIHALAGDSLFSRYTTGCVLAWEHGTLQLDFLFGREARMAWVANAVAQLAAESKSKLSDDVLERFQHITVPRNSKEKNRLMGREIGSLDFGDFIARANLMAATKWTEVLATHRAQILQSNP